MSKIDGIKEQYPYLDISLLDILKKFDVSNTNKYLPLFCKIFKKSFDFRSAMDDLSEPEQALLEHIDELKSMGFDPNLFSTNEIFFVNHFMSIFKHYELATFRKFMDLNERKLIENNDITSYKDYNEIENSVSLAEMKYLNIELSKSIYKVHEDESWLIIRPLTHEASRKYGATTRWCTASEKDTETFQRYWRDGILVYFINKKSGLKVGGYKPLKYEESYSFWSAADDRVDFLFSNLDEYLIPIIKEIFSSKETNADLCPDDLKTKMLEESHKIRHLDSIRRIITPNPTSINDEDTIQSENYAEYFNRYNSNMTTPMDANTVTTTFPYLLNNSNISMPIDENTVLGIDGI